MKGWAIKASGSQFALSIDAFQVSQLRYLGGDPASDSARRPLFSMSGVLLHAGCRRQHHRRAGFVGSDCCRSEGAPSPIP